MDIKDLRNEEGYTLVETLVAMAIFVSVLIPLGASVGNILLSTDTSRQRKALAIAESELNTAIESSDVVIAERTIDGFIAVIRTEHSERIKEVTVTVFHASNTKKILVTLHKAVLWSEKQHQ